MVPLFSIPSRASWGIGEIPDLQLLSRWLETAGFDFVQLLPVNEMAEEQSSPYSALTAMAIDPVFLALREVDDFADAGGEAALAASERTDLQALRESCSVDYANVRRLKTRALGLAFESFVSRHWGLGTARADELRRFEERERWWLEDYSLFRALREEKDARSWLEWSSDIRDRQPAAMRAARQRLERRILYYDYVQWLADQQWQRARHACGPVGIVGDFPFMVSSDSADVWARQEEFRVDVSVGVPPDAFSESGQDWGLPAYRWDVAARHGYEWLNQRTRRCAELFDGFRVDHLVGFYRTYIKESDGTTYFAPDEESEQCAQGERLLNLFSSHGAMILAEDLGTVPDFVRASMAKLGVPGTKVFRWEREWEAPGQPFRDPAQYPSASVATSGTHDTETLAEWWESAGDEERQRAAEVPLLQTLKTGAGPTYSPAIRDAVLEALVAARSNVVILPIQDVFGWRARINRPASVGDENWTWRLPFPVDDLLTADEPRERAAFLRRIASRHGRSGR